MPEPGDVLANAQGRDVFVVCQGGICSDGIFDRDWNTYPVTELTSLDASSPELDELFEHLAEWVETQRRAEAGH
jgi:hypothetical protein